MEIQDHKLQYNLNTERRQHYHHALVHLILQI